MNYQLEICANSLASCVEAQKGGARRVELCASMPEGGVTPSYGAIALARELLDIELYVIVRPRSGDFLYSELEHEIMVKDVENARRLGANGVALGCLTADGDVDMRRNGELIAAAGAMGATFHRAFDVCRDPLGSLEKIISLGFCRILSSGQRQLAQQGTPLLKELVRRAGDRIIIMPGSGINAGNISTIARETGAKEFHLSARTPEGSAMRYLNPDVVIDECVRQVTSSGLVSDALNALKESSLI
jgi:copper homeostasis protein